MKLFETFDFCEKNMGLNQMKISFKVAAIFFLLVLAPQKVLASWGLQDVMRISLQGGNDRCDSTVTGDRCSLANQYALDAGAIDSAAFNWVQNNGWFVTQIFPGQPGSLCKCGCFSGETELISASGATLRADQIREGDQLYILSSESKLSNITLEIGNVKLTTSGSERRDMFDFNLNNGKILKVTGKHGMVLSDGRIVEAEKVLPSDSFLSLDGLPVQIDSIARSTPAEYVYNFELQGEDKLSHILVAEGVLVGDLAWQNQFVRDLGLIQIRE